MESTNWGLGQASGLGASGMRGEAESARPGLCPCVTTPWVCDPYKCLPVASVYLGVKQGCSPLL